MLDPDARSLYTAMVTAPPGHVFDEALAATYSLDPAALLSLPTHLALADRSATADPVRLLESLRRLSGRFAVYVDHAGIRPPAGSHLLFGLLESMVIPVKAPRAGAFHPKLWVLRFLPPEQGAPPLIRLLILSRNLTFDSTWDLSLQLEGRPGSVAIRENRQLAELIAALPGMSTRGAPKAHRRQAERLADEVERAAWELPEGYEHVKFHALGVDARRWRPRPFRRMAVMSPFLTADALAFISAHGGRLVAVVSRQEAFDGLNREKLPAAGKYLTLADAAETEDGEAIEQPDAVGLHAKLYLGEGDGVTRLYVGSANTTSAALLKSANVEILAELVGPTAEVGGVDALLAPDGLGAFLTDYSPSDVSVDEEKQLAKKALEEARVRLAEALLKVFCRPDEDGWFLEITGPKPVEMAGIGEVRAWPITVPEKQAVDAAGLARGETVTLGRYAVESITGLVAFELVSELRALSLRLVLNLEVEGMPAEREDAIFRLVVKNREGFLRYLMLLLGEAGARAFGAREPFGAAAGGGVWASPFDDDVAVLEELTRAFSRRPQKLKEVEEIIRRLDAGKGTEAVVPQEFRDIWAVFAEALAGAGR